MTNALFAFHTTSHKVVEIKRQRRVQSDISLPGLETDLQYLINGKWQDSSNFLPISNSDKIFMAPYKLFELEGAK